MSKRRKKKKKKSFGTFIMVILVAFIVIFIADLKFNFLPSNIFGYNTSKIDTTNYKYLSQLNDKFTFSDNFDMKIPSNFNIPPKEIIDEKYNVFLDTAVISDENIDIIIQPYNIDITNEKKVIQQIREDVIKTTREKLPTVNLNEGKTVKVNGQYVSIITFITTYKEEMTYTDIAFLEVNGKLLTITMNSVKDYLYTQELFMSIIKTIEVK